MIPGNVAYAASQLTAIAKRNFGIGRIGLTAMLKSILSKGPLPL
jgi:hypothetical protein